MSENKFELIIENGVVTGYKGKSKVIEIPEGVTEIGECAFQDCQFIEEFYSKNSVLKTIGDFAFENCKNLKVCKLDALKGSIESSAFYGCKKLKSFEVPNGTIKIGSDAFGHCDSLIYVIIPSSVFVLDSYIFDVGNKKTVILGDNGSEAEEYARSKMLPFKENTPATRNELLQLENKKDNTGYKDFNIFGETIRCYKSVIVYQELLDFFKTLNVDFSNEVMNSIPNDIMKCDEKAGNIVYLSQTYSEKVRIFLQKYGVFISDTVFSDTTLKYEANYLEVCGAYIDACNKCMEAIKEGKANLQSDLIAEAKSKVTGLSYGVIGDSLTMVAYAIDDYRARKRQINEAYDVAASKLTTGTNQIINQTQNIYANLLNDTLLPAFDKSVSYVCDGLMQLTIEEMLEAKVIDKKVFEIYDIAKSSKLIEQAKKNSSIDKKYAIAVALKLYPLNSEAIVLSFKEDLIEKNTFDLIEYLELHQMSKLKNYFHDHCQYISLIKLKNKYATMMGDGFTYTINEIIDTKAGDLIDRINKGYDPARLDKETWNSLVKSYIVLSSENRDNFNLTEKDIEGSNGQQLLSEAIRKNNEIKKIQTNKANTINQYEIDIKALKDKIAEYEKEIADAWEIKALIGFFVLFLIAIIALVGSIALIILIIDDSYYWDDNLLELLFCLLGVIAGGYGTISCLNALKYDIDNTKNKKREIETLKEEIIKKETELRHIKNRK